MFPKSLTRLVQLKWESLRSNKSNLATPLVTTDDNEQAKYATPKQKFPKKNFHFFSASNRKAQAAERAERAELPVAPVSKEILDVHTLNAMPTEQLETSEQGLEFIARGLAVRHQA